MPPNPENLKPFQKGGDPRIWKGGRPKSFSALQELAQQIAHETAKAGGATVTIDGHSVNGYITKSHLDSHSPRVIC